MSSGSKPRNGLVSCPGASSHGCTKLIPKKEKQGRRKRKEEKNEKKGKKEKRKRKKKNEDLCSPLLQLPYFTSALLALVLAHFAAGAPFLLPLTGLILTVQQLLFHVELQLSRFLFFAFPFFCSSAYIYIYNTRKEFFPFSLFFFLFLFLFLFCTGKRSSSG